MRILVVGGYGLIGSAVLRALASHGHEASGAGRDLSAARRRFPNIAWMQAELGRTDAAAWAEGLRGVEVVVNAAGALQDGLSENLKAVHVTGLEALVEGCRRAGVRRLVQISAAGVAPGRGGSFNDTKAEGEAVVAGSGLDWIILRPGLVFGPTAFGGTAMLRGLAGFPLVTPCIHPKSRLQPVGLDTVAEAIVRAAEPGAPAGVALDLVGADSLPLDDMLRRLRGWLGLGPAPVLAAPEAVARLAARVADGLGWLGWRTPLRTNAVDQIGLGMASPGGGEAALGLVPQRFDDILANLPSSLQERRFARLYFAKPALLIGLSAFCALTGLLSLTQAEASMALLAPAGLPAPVSKLLIVGGGLLDLTLAIGLAVRAWAPRALLGLIGLSGVYLLMASLLRPDLWLDPLGSLSKTLLVMLLAGLALGMMDER